jgi:hypothetical protein
MINSAFWLTVSSRMGLAALLVGGSAWNGTAIAGGATSVDPSTVSSPASMAGDTASASVTQESESPGQPRVSAPPSVSGSPAVSGPENRPTDSNKAREAGRKGLVRSYGWMLKRIKKIVTGDVVKVQLLQHPGDQWTYDVTVLSESGRYVKISLNAATGAVISKKSR